MDKVYLNDLGIINALGNGKAEILNSLKEVSGRYGDLQPGVTRVPWGGSPVFSVDAKLPPVDRPVYDNRVNHLLAEAAGQISRSISKAVSLWGPSRIGVVLGSTDNGSEIAFESVRHHENTGGFPESFSLECQNPNNSPLFLKSLCGLEGPEMSVSTACSSSAVAMIQARELILGGVSDAVICGGSDIVSRAVYMGFQSLEAVAPGLCNPFSINRAGITLGEGAALFMMSRKKITDHNILLLGTGESADAHHMTAPHPDGVGAEAAMRAALDDAGCSPGEIDYLNLHGTGTELNDSMESRAVSRLFGGKTPCSSTKALTGHTLGAAGATEAGLSWIILAQDISLRQYPIHRWDGIPDPGLPELNLVSNGTSSGRLEKVMSNSFAFGGNNTSLVIGVDK